MILDPKDKLGRPQPEVERRLKKLETGVMGESNRKDAGAAAGSGEYKNEQLYIAYASDISNSDIQGSIENQSDASDFSFFPFLPDGTVLTWRGAWFSKSFYQSGDATDYTWVDITDEANTFVLKRYTTTYSYLLSDMGNPDEPEAETWVLVLDNTLPIAETVFWVAEQFTINDVKSKWYIYPANTKDTGFALISYTITGRNKPVLGDAQWNLDAIAAVTSFTGKVYSSITEFGYGTTLSIQYDDGRLYGVLKKINGVATWVTPLQSIDAALLVDTTIIGEKIAANAIDVQHILDGAIDADKIALNAINVQHILDGAIDADKIADNAVNTTHISAGSITANEIQADAIGANHIAANVITAGEIAVGTITATEIQADSIGANEIAANAITADEIAANSITSGAILAGTVTALEMEAGTITANEIAVNAITSDLIISDAITADKIRANAIGAIHIKVTGTGPFLPSTIGAGSQADLITAQTTADSKVLPEGVADAINNNSTSISGAKITTGSINALQIATNAITAAKIDSNVISSTHIVDGEISETKIAGGAITTSKIATDAITSDKMATDVLLVGGKIESSNYDWNAGSPVGFSMYSAGDPDSGSSYNIIGGSIYGGTIKAVTLESSTMSVRDLNVINDNGDNIEPIFSTSGAMSTSGQITAENTYTMDFLTDFYTYNSTSTSKRKTVGTSGTTISLFGLEPNTMPAFDGYVTLAQSDPQDFSSISVLVKVGTTTLASKTTSWSLDTDYDVGGFTFRWQGSGYLECFTIATTAEPDLASTSSSTIHIEVALGFATETTATALVNSGLVMIVSNL